MHKNASCTRYPYIFAVLSAALSKKKKKPLSITAAACYNSAKGEET